MAPSAAAGLTISAIGGVLLLGTIPALAAFGTGLLLVLWTAGRGRVALNAVRLTAPFLFPLLLVHGVLNPSYATTGGILGIPIRVEGARFAATVALRILSLTAAALSWPLVEPERLMAAAGRAGVSTSLIVLVAAAIATTRALGARIEAVYLAQQARGMASGPAFGKRLLALPTVVIPVVTATLFEGMARGESLTSRGLGSTQLALTAAGPQSTTRDHGVAASGFVLLGLCRWLF